MSQQVSTELLREIDDEAALRELLSSPGWAIMSRRMDKMLAEAERVLDSLAGPDDTFRLHRTLAMRKLLVTLLAMVRNAPERHDALVSSMSAPAADSALPPLV